MADSIEIEPLDDSAATQSENSLDNPVIIENSDVRNENQEAENVVGSSSGFGAGFGVG